MKRAFFKLAGQHGPDSDSDDQESLKSCIKKRPHDSVNDGKRGLFRAKRKKKKVRFDGTADSAWKAAV